MSRLLNYRVLSFDVYATLVDWETSLLNALQPLLSNAPHKTFSREKLLTLYHELEHEQQKKEPNMRYTDVLTSIHPQIAARLGVSAPTVSQSTAFGQSVSAWPAFPDTVGALRRLARHYKLVVLSNVDRESFTRSNAGPLQGLPFNLVITAQDVGSYKPDLRNFEYMLAEVEGKLGVKKEQGLQTAQSQLHDHHPAKQLGIKSSWIVRPGATMGNREKEVYDWKFDSLGEMADALEKEIGSTV